MEFFAATEHVPIIKAREREAFTAAVAQAQPHRMLELGTAIGYSTLLLLLHAAPDAEVTTLELSSERYAQARGYFARTPFAARVHQLQGDASALLDTLTGPYDFVFIDAAKGQYPDYLRKVLPLLTPQATIISDNVLFRGYVQSHRWPPHRYRTLVLPLRRDLRAAQQLPRATTQVLPHGDGMAVTRLHDTVACVASLTQATAKCAMEDVAQEIETEIFPAVAWCGTW